MKNTEEMKDINIRRLVVYEALLAEKGVCTPAEKAGKSGVSNSEKK